MQPFSRGKKYFLKTITFYYIAEYKKKRGKFFEFANARCLLSIPDWPRLVDCKPGLPKDIKPLEMGTLHINEEAIMDAMPWE